MPGLNQMSSTSSGGASVITLQFSLELVARRRRAGSAGGDQRVGNLPAHRPADAADLQQGQSGRHADPHARRSRRRRCRCRKLQDLADTRLAQKISQLPGVGLVASAAASGRRCASRSNPKALAALRPVARRRAHRDRQRATSNQAKGSFDGPTRASTIDANDQLKSADEYQQLIIAYRNGAPVRLSDVADVVDGAENTRLAAWANATPGDHPQHPAPARRQRHRGRRPHQGAAAAAAGVAARRGRRRRC